MRMRPISIVGRFARSGVLIACCAAALVAAGCGTDESSTETSSNCPTEPVSVVASIDQWGSVARQLGGDCVDVTTIVTSAVGDPHDFEPRPADIAAFNDAQLIVVNGLDYDHWAEEAIEEATAPVINAGTLAGRTEGDNPHLWNDPTAIAQVADAITDRLNQLAPKAQATFTAARAEWDRDIQRYQSALSEASAVVAQRSATYVATEPVVQYLADALGLRDLTPAGYRNAAANESEPSPGDLAELESLLDAGTPSLLVVNRQTENPSVTQLIKHAGDVPIVKVGETAPTNTDGFIDWQIDQITDFTTALTTSPK